jgi:DNA polymerase V
MPSGGARKGAGRPKGKGKYNEPTKAIRLPLSIIQALEKKQFPQLLPLYLSKVSAGFPSPAEDDLADKLDLNDYLIKHPAATFLVRANGLSMINAGIHENDILIVDRSLTPSDGKIVIAAIDGQLTVKRLKKNNDGSISLLAENPDYQPIHLHEENDVVIWGVVTNVIHNV